MRHGSDRSAEPSRHPHHDAINQEVRGWFTRSLPEFGLEVEQLQCGPLGDLGNAGARLVLEIDDPAGVPAALADVRSAATGRNVTIWVDDRTRARRLDTALRAAGCARGHATTYLALVGDLLADPGPTDLLVEDVTEDGLEEWCDVKLRCFADSEAAPAADAVMDEIGVRRSERSFARCVLGSIDHEPVAVLACYKGADQLVFNLGTRVPYRHRRIAQALLAHWVAGAVDAGSRSMIINAEEGGRPAALYRRMGFVDEIYWYRRYELAASRG
jgi:hypothetical protein